MATSHDWEIGELYRKSWKLVRANPMLWFLGIAAGVGSSQTFRLGNQFSSSGSKLGSAKPVIPPQLVAAVKGMLFSVPVWVYILLAVVLLVSVGIQIVLMLVYRAWATGLLLAETYVASEHKKPSLAAGSRLAQKAIPGMLAISIVPGLVIFLVMAIATGAYAGSFVLLSKHVLRDLPLLLFILLLVVFTIGGLYFFIRSLILLTFTTIWASRRLVFHSGPTATVFWDSWRVAKKKFWSMAGLGFMNSLMSMGVSIVSFLPLIVVGLLGVAGYFVTKAVPWSAPFLLFLGAVAACAYFIVMGIVGGAFVSFKASVWNFAYHAIEGVFHEA
jgi:hypothetical protein